MTVELSCHCPQRFNENSQKTFRESSGGNQLTNRLFIAESRNSIAHLTTISILPPLFKISSMGKKRLHAFLTANLPNGEPSQIPQFQLHFFELKYNTSESRPFQFGQLAYLFKFQIAWAVPSRVVPYSLSISRTTP